MVDTVHSQMTRANGGIHTPFSWIVANEAARLALVVTVGTDINKLCLQQDDGTIYQAQSVNPVVWQQVGGGAVDLSAYQTTTQADAKYSIHDSFMGNRFITKAKEQVRATTNRGKYAAATSYVAGDVVWTDDMGVGSPQVDIWMFLEAVTSPATLPAVASGDGAFLMGAYIARYQATMLKGFFNGQASTGYTTPGHPDNAVTDVTMDILPGLGSVFLYDIKFNDAGTPSASLAAYGPGYMCVNSPGTYFHPSNVDPGRYVVVNEGYNNFGQPTLAREHGYLSAIGASAAAARIPLTVGIVAGYMTDDPWTGDEVAIGSVILNGTTITEPLLALMFEGDVFPADGSPIYYRMSYVGVAPEDAEANARVRWLTAPDTATVMRIGTYLGNNQILIDTQAV